MIFYYTVCTVAFIFLYRRLPGVGPLGERVYRIFNFSWCCQFVLQEDINRAIRNCVFSLQPSQQEMFSVFKRLSVQWCIKWYYIPYLIFILDAANLSTLPLFFKTPITCTHSSFFFYYLQLHLGIRHFTLNTKLIFFPHKKPHIHFMNIH